MKMLCDTKKPLRKLSNKKIPVVELKFNLFAAAGLHLWDRFSSDQRNASSDATKYMEEEWEQILTTPIINNAALHKYLL